VTPPAKVIVLDASAVVTFFEDRPGAARVEDLIVSAAASKIQLLMSLINWGEVYYSIWRARGHDAARQIIAEIAQLPIDLIPADYPLTKLAAELHARHNLPYADCFAASLATTRHASVATSDKDFAKLARHLPILWTT
jgi:predicted nucleic acid-binding protein